MVKLENGSKILLHQAVCIILVVSKLAEADQTLCITLLKLWYFYSYFDIFTARQVLFTFQIVMQIKLSTMRW